MGSEKVKSNFGRFSSVFEVRSVPSETFVKYIIPR